MGPALVIVAAIVVVAIVGALLMGPRLQQKGDEAIARAKQELGGDGKVLEIEPKAVGLMTEPPEAGTGGGQGVLAVSADTIVFVTWGKQDVMKIPRSSVTSIECSADDPGAVQKATIIVNFEHEGSPAKGQFRIARDLVSWLTTLGYDWGPGGPPAPPSDDEA